ncbi:hypothetical protein AURDEDRAFT_68005, partial [Auricularia subglabra TFB-10046 SS5]
GWQASSVKIRVPTGVKKGHGPTFNEFEVPGIHHRSLTSLMDQVRVTDVASRTFHNIPYRQQWQPHNSTWPRETIHSELYSSDLFIRLHDELQDSPREPDCTLERVVDAILLGSDSMLLTDFGHACLWPVYAWYGNQSKYNRARPSADACDTVAYVEKLPGNIGQFLQEHRKTHSTKNKTRLVHLRRELFHACLQLILEKYPELMRAYNHGRVIRGTDCVTRRHYPRFLNCSADYPENCLLRVLLVTIRDMGDCHWPGVSSRRTSGGWAQSRTGRWMRKEHPREESPERLSLLDSARNFVFGLGYAVASVFVENELKGESWTLTQNAFSWLIAYGAPNIFHLLRVDLMREFELGVWKALIARFIRILHT